MSEMQDEQPAGSGGTDPAFVVEPTGHARIDAALERLERLDALEIAAHPEEFDAIHGVLRESLANAGRDEPPLESA
jgi:hypothetical protein